MAVVNRDELTRIFNDNANNERKSPFSPIPDNYTLSANGFPCENSPIASFVSQ
jgi:hypothetical protein